jgi:Cytochrome C oxidase, cbb3-type, subunit III
MPKRIDGRLLWRRTLLLLACLLIALATVTTAAGCGSDESDSGSGSSSVARVRRVVRVERVRQDRWTYARARFHEMCAGCHTLADAGATGRRFNLDHGGGTDETHVRGTIAYGEPGMPGYKDVLSPREFEELVAYIVTVARRTSGDDLWHDQLSLRGAGNNWTRKDTDRLEAYALRIVRERMPKG